MVADSRHLYTAVAEIESDIVLWEGLIPEVTWQPTTARGALEVQHATNSQKFGVTRVEAWRTSRW